MRIEINDWFSCRFQYEVSGGEISTCLISSHQQSWHIHLRSRQAGSAPEWQVWCHANCCFTEDSVTCPWMTYLWHTQCRTYCQKVLIFTSSACFKLMSYWSSLLRLLEVIFSYETLCNLYNLFLLLLHWEYEQQAKKKKKNDAIKHFILSLVNESQISMGRKPSLMNPSRTSVMVRHVKVCFDFWDVYARAGHTSNLPAVWQQYQTIPLNYLKGFKLVAFILSH